TAASRSSDRRVYQWRCSGIRYSGRAQGIVLAYRTGEHPAPRQRQLKASTYDTGPSCGQIAALSICPLCERLSLFDHLVGAEQERLGDSQPCFATRLGGVSGNKETQGWRDSSHTAMVGAGKFGSAKLPMATATYPQCLPALLAKLRKQVGAKPARRGKRAKKRA